VSEPVERPDAVSRLSNSAEPGVWRFAMAKRASVIVDAANYFSVMQQAMLQARRRLMMVGWDFDTRIHLDEGRRWYEKGRRATYPRRLGSFIVWLTNHRDELEIRMLKWSFGVFKFAFRGSMWMDLVRWTPHKQIDFKFDTAHPVGCSHHQKIVVLDNTLAVCGGIDMTARRWDTREHLEEDPRRVTPNGAVYEPWHDATMMVEGEVAQALEDLARDRWIRAGGEPLEEIPPRNDSLWPEALPVQFENVEIGIARTRAGYRDWDEVQEIEELFCLHIARAKRFIYAESQYFASRKITECIIARVEEDDPPEIVIVHPHHADGWLEKQAMDHARAELVRLVEQVDHKNRFTIWSPVSGKARIYVHAKIMIVDDEILRIGSANMNNRSMGLDSECDMFIDAARPANAGAERQIAKLRHSLLAEHCGLDEEDVPELLKRHGSMAGVIEHCDERNVRKLERYHPPELNDAERELVQSQVLDPEDPEDMLAPYAGGGLYRDGSRLKRVRARIRRKLRR